MATIATLRIRLVAKTKDFSTGLKRVERDVDRLGKRFRNLGQRLTLGVTVPLGLAGIAAGKLAVDFGASMSTIEGLVGIAADKVDAMGESVLNLSGVVAKSPQELADALFFVTSAGFRGAEAMQVLENAAKAAAAGLGDTVAVASAVTSVINTYGSANIDAGKATGILVAAIRAGSLEAGELAPVLGRVIPIAQEIGVSFDQVAAAMAALSLGGIPASEAVSQLKAVFKAFLKPGAEAIAAFKEAETSLDQVRKSVREKGLLATLEALRVQFKKTGVEISKVFPDVEGLGAVLALTGQNAEANRKIFKDLADATINDLDAAFLVATKTAKFKFNQALSVLSATMIRLGDEILPLVVPLVQKMTVVMRNLAQQFAELSPKARKTILVIAGFAVAAGPILIAAGLIISAGSAVIGFFGTIATVLSFVVANIIGALAAINLPFIAAAALIVGAGVLIVTRWESLAEDLKNIWTGIISFLEDSFVGKGIKLISKFVKKVSEKIGELRAVVSPKLKAVGASVKNFAKDSTEGIRELFQTLKDEVEALFSGTVSTTIRTDEALRDALNKANLANEETRKGLGQTETAFTRFNKKVTENTDNIGKRMEELGNSTAAGIGEMTAELAQGSLALDDFVKKAIAALSKLAIQAAFAGTGPIGAFLGGFGGGLFSGGFAEGGFIPRGTFGVVGEQGPELAFAGAGATITPMAEFMGGGLTLNQVNNLSGFDLGDRRTVRRFIREFAEEAKNETVEAVQFGRRLSDLSEKNSRRAT